MICSACGHEYGIGDWPWCPHGAAHAKHPFRSWIDEHISDKPVEITSLAQWNRLMKQNNMDLRDKPTRGDLEARKDKCMEIQKELRHAD